MQKLEGELQRLIVGLKEDRTRGSNERILRQIKEKEHKCAELRQKSMELLHENEKAIQERNVYVTNTLEKLTKNKCTKK